VVRERVWVPDRGDIVWLHFDPRAGHEQAGRRPAFVVSPRAYNRKVGLALFCPITSRVKGYAFEVVLPAGAKAQGAILSDQLKSLDWKARKARRLEHASDDVIDQVTSRILALVDPQPNERRP
jgi:mRNA interferase MazF